MARRQQPSEPLFSLSVGDGRGAFLGQAAGDVAGGAVPDGYGYLTQMMMVAATHALRKGGIEIRSLTAEWRKLIAGEAEGPVLRGASPAFLDWAASLALGEPEPMTGETYEPGLWLTGLTLRMRRTPEILIEQAVEVASVTTIDAPSLVAAAVAVAGVGASVVTQVGADLLFGAAESAERALAHIAARHPGATRQEVAASIPGRLRDLIPHIDDTGPDLVALISGDEPPIGVNAILLAIVLAAPRNRKPVDLVARAARVGGSPVGALVGAMMGARTGREMWPWDVPEREWFVELGRRYEENVTDLSDFTDPYDLEAHRLLGRPIPPPRQLDAGVPRPPTRPV